MNFSWLDLFRTLMLEVTLVVGSALALSAMIRSGLGRRSLWQACILALGLLVTCESTGTARALVAWLAAPHQTERPGTPEPRPLTIGLSAIRPQNIWVNEEPTLVTASPATSVRQTWWPGIVWVTGFVLIGTRLGFAMLMFGRFRKQRRLVHDSELIERLCDIANRLRVRRSVRLSECEALHTPVAFGIFHPCVCVPAFFTQRFNPSQQSAMLAHEMAHIAGHDAVWFWLADFVTALLWWHPLVWFARRQFHASSEAAADEASLTIENGPDLLAECLVELGARLQSSHSSALLRMSGFRSDLGRRVERLMQLPRRTWKPVNRATDALVKITVLLALTFVALVCLAWTDPPAPGSNFESAWKNSLTSLAFFATKAAIEDFKLKDISPNPLALPVAKTKSTSRKPVLLANAQAASIETRKPPASSPEPPEGSGQTGTTDPDSRKSGQGQSRMTMRQKVERIILPQVIYDGVPLKEVVSDLVEQSRLRDPEKRGISIIINSSPRVPPPATGSPAIDPGNPLPPRDSTEPLDLSTVLVRLHLREVTLEQVIDAVCKFAETPLKYSIEPNAVVFRPSPPADAETLFTRVFKVEPGAFIAGIKGAMGYPSEGQLGLSGEKAIGSKNLYGSPLPGPVVDMPAAPGDALGRLANRPGFSGGSSAEPQIDRPKSQNDLVRAFFTGAGVDFPKSEPGKAESFAGLEGRKAVFFNDRTGVIFARATLVDLEVMDKAIQVTLSPKAPPQTEKLETRVFRVDPIALDTSLERWAKENPKLHGSSAAEVAKWESVSELLNRYFAAAGVEFPAYRIRAQSLGVFSGETPVWPGETEPGGTQPASERAPRKALFFTESSGLIYVRAGRVELDKIDQAIQSLHASPRQVQIEVRFVELPEADSKVLGFDWLPRAAIRPETVYGAPPPGPVVDGPASAPDAESQLLDRRGSPKGVRGVAVAPAPRRPNAAPSLRSAVLNEAQFGVVRRALEQRKGVEVLTAPRVTTSSGHRTKIDPAEINEIASSDGNRHGTRAFPSIEIIPSVREDGGSLDFTVFTSDTEFLGYDDPGPFGGLGQLETRDLFDPPQPIPSRTASASVPRPPDSKQRSSNELADPRSSGLGCEFKQGCPTRRPALAWPALQFAVLQE